MNQFFIKLLLIFIITGTCNNQVVIAKSKAPAAPTPAPAPAATSSLPIITRGSKNDLPADLTAQAQSVNMSILTPTPEQLPLLYQSYPQGATLFPNNSDIATSFDAMIGAIKSNSDLITFFRKIYLMSLNQLYDYLMKIYTNFNLTNPGCIQTTTTPTADVSAYLTDDATYATNKKKLILNHFINLIQAQFAAAVISYVPTADPTMAVSLGELFLANDYGIDLTPFAQKQTDAKTIASQAPFFTFLQQYINFFQTYTNYLSKADPTTGVNQYYSIAQNINSLLQPAAGAQPALAMNPSMFFYNIESMRSILFIPFVANQIPAKSQNIPWAPTVVQSATSNATSNGHAVAYFTDAAGKNTTSQAQAQHLYLLTELGSALFEQELLAQPAWMNTQDGSIRILRACLGDFSVLVGLGILDSQTEAIIQKAIALGSTQTKQ